MTFACIIIIPPLYIYIFLMIRSNQMPILELRTNIAININQVVRDNTTWSISCTWIIASLLHFKCELWIIIATAALHLIVLQDYEPMYIDLIWSCLRIYKLCNTLHFIKACCSNKHKRLQYYLILANNTQTQ